MRPMTLRTGLFLALAVATASARAADAPKTIELWPGQAPGESGSIGEEQAKKNAAGAVVSLTNVTKPTLTVSRPEKDNDTQVAILVCPGGGYTNLAWDHEGEQVARWLNSIGVTAAILKYRVPRRPGTDRDEPPGQPLMDAQRALRLIRSHADDWGIDPKRVGMLGFSAGGHLTAAASTNSDKTTYEPIDEADKLSARPDFAVMVYPGGVVRKGTVELRPEIKITSETPPTFLAHANDDPVSPENSAALYLALKHAGVPAELHIYAKGGHGFGMRPGPNPASTWPKRCEDWMRSQGILKP